MALFGNDYDRDYGYRGTHRDHDRGMMDRAGNTVRRGWNNVRDTFDGDNDRGDYGYRGDNTRYGTTGFGNTGWGTSGYATGRNDYDAGYRGMNNGFGGARESFNDNRGNMYGTGYGNAGPAYGPAYGAGSNMDYDRDYGYRGTAGYGYDHNMKSRAQTDRGDPYGDRAAHTPVRVMRGGYERNGMGIDYDRQYKEGLGDDPYYNRGGMNAGGTYRGNMYDRGYRDNDRGWF